MNHITIHMKSIYDAFYITPKPVLQGTGAAAMLTWNVPIRNCGITATNVAASGTEGQSGYNATEIHHVIYVNAPAASAHVMHQVKLTCKSKTVIDERIVSK